MDCIAHIKELDGRGFKCQGLIEHLQGTSEMSGEFAKAFSNENWGMLLGRLHDLGKLSDEFQAYIKINSGYEDGERLGKTDHTSAAAILSKEYYHTWIYNTLARGLRCSSFYITYNPKNLRT